MKRLLLTLSSSALLLAPTSAFAAFQTPGELIVNIQQGSARSFDVQATGAADQTYLAIWMKGVSQGSTPTTMKMKTDATLDVVRGGEKMRAKGEMMVTDGSLYLHVDSIEGSLVKPFSASKDWAVLPFTQEMATEMTNGIALDIGSFDPAGADEMFRMTRTESGDVETYTLTLASQTAPELAQRIRDMLGDDQPVSDDFFPWQALEDGTELTMTIKMSSGKFVSSVMKLSLKTKHASFSATTTETALAGGVEVDAPTNASAFSNFVSALSVWIAAPIGATENVPVPTWMMPDTSPAPVYTPSARLTPYGTNFDSVEPTIPEVRTWIGEGSCSGVSDIMLVTLQRMGACPVIRVPTRESWYRWMEGR